MMSRDSRDIREVIFINERCRLDYEAMPAEVRESADQAIDALQNLRGLPATQYRSLGGSLAGISEISLEHDTGTYLVYVTLKCYWVIMVLDAGMGESIEGKNIPKRRKGHLEERLKKALEYFADQDSHLKADYDRRKARRDGSAKDNGS
jgi:hypothetical protein